MNSVFLRRSKSENFQTQINWCKENFGPGPEVTSVIQAENYRWSYENVGFGIRSLHFREETDYMFYLLRWK